MKIIDIEGIGEVYAKKLKEAGIDTSEELLEAGKTEKGRTGLVEKTGISQKLILRWVNHADLFRIDGVGEEYADLLEASGVDTVIELAKRKPENLTQKMAEVNGQKHLVRKLPALSQVERWVEQAKQLPRMLTY